MLFCNVKIHDLLRHEKIKFIEKTVEQHDLTTLSKKFRSSSLAFCNGPLLIGKIQWQKGRREETVSILFDSSFLQAIRWHGGVILVDPTLQDNVLQLDDFAEHICHIENAFEVHSEGTGSRCSSQPWTRSGRSWIRSGQTQNRTVWTYLESTSQHSFWWNLKLAHREESHFYKLGHMQLLFQTHCQRLYSVNSTPTNTARTELHSMITIHNANTRGSRAAKLRIADLCVPKTSVIHVSRLIPCRTWHWQQAQVLCHLPLLSFRQSHQHTQDLWYTIHICLAKFHGRVADQHKSHVLQVMSPNPNRLSPKTSRPKRSSLNFSSPEELSLTGIPYQKQERCTRNSLAEGVDEFGKVGSVTSHLESQMHSD